MTCHSWDKGRHNKQHQKAQHVAVNSGLAVPYSGRGTSYQCEGNPSKLDKSDMLSQLSWEITPLSTVIHLPKIDGVGPVDNKPLTK